MTKKLSLIVLIFLVKVCLALPSHNVSTTNVTIGQTFQYTISFPEKIPTNLQPTFGPFEMVSSTIKDTPSATNYVYKLQTFSIKPLIIPTQTIQLQHQPLIHLLPIHINLISTLSPTKNQLNDIAPIFNLFYINWWIIAAITLTIITILILLLLWKKRQNKHLISEATLQKDPPNVIALNQIKALKKSLINNPTSIKQGYFKLTEIFCIFLTDTLFIDVLDSTTVEMKQLLKNSDRLSPDQYKDIIQLSNQMDIQKFSKSPTLLISEFQDTIQHVETIIKKVSYDH